MLWYLGMWITTHSLALPWKTPPPFPHSPKDTPFEDGTFKLTMQFSEEYPNKPPIVRFVSKMFHPNGEGYWWILWFKNLILSCSCLISVPPSLPLSLSLPPSVYADGSICLDILQNRWSPTYDVSSILTSIQVCTIKGFLAGVRHLKLHSHCAVFIRWTQPKQSGKQPSSSTLSGEQKRIRKESTCYSGGELDEYIIDFK